MKASRKTLMAMMVLGMSVALLETSAMAGADKADEHFKHFNTEEKVVHSGAGSSNTIVIVSGREDNHSRMAMKNFQDAPGSTATRTVIGSEGSNANVNMKQASDTIDNGSKR